MTIYNASDFGFSVDGVTRMSDREAIRAAAWANVEHGLDVGEDDSADAIYTDAYDLAFDGALKVTDDWNKAREIATEVAMCFAQP